MKFLTGLSVLSAFGIMLLASSPLQAQEAASGKVKIEEKSVVVKEKNKAASVKGMPNFAAPYRLINGKRDPFVPFGGHLAPATTVKTVLHNQPETTEKKVVVKDAQGKNVVKTVVVDSVSKKKDTIVTLPVTVTGTLVSAGQSYAIITSEGSGGASYMVKPGDKVGEYTVRSVSPREVVLIWKGKAYTIPIKAQTFNKMSSGLKTGLPVPQQGR